MILFGWIVIQPALAAPGDLLYTIYNPTPSSHDYFGTTLATTDHDLLVGVDRDNSSGAAAGAVYVFNGTSGNLLHSFLSPTVRTSEYFGGSVAAVGNDILVGAYQHQVNGVTVGEAYLHDGDTGNLLHTFANPTPEDGDWFGCAVAGAGNKILIGAKQDDMSTIDSGSAYLFDAVTGSLLRTIQNPTPDYQDRFGATASAMGNDFLVVAPADDFGYGDRGSVYRFDANTGNLKQTYHHPFPTDGSTIAKAIPMGDDILVTAPFFESNGAVFVIDGDTGQLLRTLQNPDGTAEGFGSSVAVMGNNVLIGAPHREVNGMLYVGAAYLFDGDTGATFRLSQIPSLTLRTPSDTPWRSSAITPISAQIRKTLL